VMRMSVGWTFIPAGLLMILCGHVRAEAQQSTRAQGLGCSQFAELRVALDSLRGLDPAADARAAASRGDHRYWAVMRYDVMIPEVPEATRKSLPAAQYRLFDHTGDGRLILWCTSPGGTTVVDSTDIHWNEAADAYAAVYNQTLMRLGR
jgi:hypothetical protein